MKSMMNQNNGIKKILILGGGGFIGGHLAKRLKNEGIETRTFFCSMMMHHLWPLVLVKL